MGKISISLTDDMTQRIKEAVSTGRYATISEVSREALREWEFA